MDTGENNSDADEVAEKRISDDERYQFGELKFDFGDGKTSKPESKRSSRTSKTSKFVKINIKDKKIDSQELLKKLSDEWKWGPPPRKQPNLLISVTGGEWNFPVNSHVKEMFRTGIVEAAHSANAWIVTGGTHVGVMKYVGEGVSDYELAMDKTMTTIGIATWGPLRDDQKNAIGAYLQNKKQQNNSNGEVQAQKSIPESKEPLRRAEDEDIAILKVHQAKEVKKPALDPNHSFFILVDDGSEEFGADVQVREDLEKEMSRTWEISDSGKVGPVTVPTVCVVIEGGPNTIKQAHKAVTNKIPIVIVANSGRPANVMAEALKELKVDLTSDKTKTFEKLTDEEYEETKKKYNIPRLVGIVGKNKVRSTVELLEEMKHYPEDISIYEESSRANQIDQMILKALIKSKHADKRVELNLAQTWNRRDIVEFGEILGHLTDTTDWKEFDVKVEPYQQNVVEALVKGQYEFVRMFVEGNVVKLETFLTKAKLAHIYKRVIDVDTKPEPFVPMQQRVWEEELKEKTGDGLLKVIKEIVRDITTPSFDLIENMDEYDINDDPLPDPHRQLFIFAMLTDYYKLAEFFWKRGDEHISAALTACGVYRTFAKDQNSELREKLMDIALKYEQRACNVLAECEEQSEENDTMDILRTPTRKWSFVNPLKLAELSGSMMFMAEPPVNRLTEILWNPWKTKREEMRNKSLRVGVNDGGRGNTSNSSDDRKSWWNDNPVCSFIRGFLLYINVPETKFKTNALFYLGFLFYFSWVMVSDQLSESSLSTAELILIVWVMTFICEEIRQAFPQPYVAFAIPPKRRSHVDQAKRYITTSWNTIDILMLSLFLLGELARISSTTRESGRIILATSLICFYLRFLRILTSVKNIGPKVLMIFKTLNDFKAMVIILLIVLVGYGTAIHAIMFPYVSDPVTTLKGVFYRPLFQIYGELFLGELTATEVGRIMCTKNLTEIRMGIKEPCPENIGWGILFLVFYMILSNVLLLNIFVAMFSTACESINSKSDLHWAYQFYNITEEYYNRPVLPPPLIVIEHIFGLIQGIYTQCKCDKTTEKQRSHRERHGERFRRRMKTISDYLLSIPYFFYYIAKDHDKNEEMYKPRECGMASENLIKREKRWAYNYITRRHKETKDESNARILNRLVDLKDMIQPRGSRTDTSLSWWY